MALDTAELPDKRRYLEHPQNIQHYSYSNELDGIFYLKNLLIYKVW